MKLASSKSGSKLSRAHESQQESIPSSSPGRKSSVKKSTKSKKNNLDDTLSLQKSLLQLEDHHQEDSIKAQAKQKQEPAKSESLNKIILPSLVQTRNQAMNIPAHSSNTRMQWKKNVNS